MKTFLVPQV